MMFRTLSFIYNHPFNRKNKIGGILRFIRWQLNCALNPYPILYPLTGKTKILAWKGLTGVTGNIYCGLLEFEDMGFLLHFLRPQDLFLDVGANVGVYTLLASGEIGAKTISIEPIQATFNILSENIKINNLEENVELLNIGLGNESGILKFTKMLDTVNHVAKKDETDTVDVVVKKMDEISTSIPNLIKIDVEGFETEVLNGAPNILNDERLKAIIIELNGSGNRYGYNEELIHEKLIYLGFKTFRYNPYTRILSKTPSFGSHNTIYIRDFEFVQNRINKSKAYKIKDRLI